MKDLPGYHKLPLDEKVTLEKINGVTLNRYIIPYYSQNFALKYNMLEYQQDLLRIGSYTLKQIDRPYNLNEPWETSVRNVYQELRQKMFQKNRIMTMVYGYYLGELIQLSITPREKWKEFVRDNHIPNEIYFYRGSARLYKLFEKNVSQIYCTLNLTYRILVRMKTTEYQTLLQYNQDLIDLTANIDMS
jgi:hypothetical protein